MNNPLITPDEFAKAATSIFARHLATLKSEAPEAETVRVTAGFLLALEEVLTERRRIQTGAPSAKPATERARLVQRTAREYAAGDLSDAAFSRALRKIEALGSP